MKAYKGTDKDMKCRGYQFELGKTETIDGRIECCERGFHSCEAPFDVLRYYPNKNGNRFFEVEAGGKVARRKNENSDSKMASSEVTLKAELNFASLVKAQVEYTRKKAKTGTAGGDYSNLAGGNWSNLAGGNSSIVVGRNGCKSKAGLHSVIVLTQWEWINEEYIPVYCKTGIIDGKTLKPDTWYKLENGEFVEAESGENDDS